MARTVRSKTQRIRYSPGSFQTGSPGDLFDVRATRRRVQRIAAFARRHPRPIAPFVPAEAVAIRVVDRGADVRYPACESDLRGLLLALPPGSADGLAVIERDTPWRVMARDGGGYEEVFPGVHGRASGTTYTPASATLRLYGYVYASDLRSHDAVDFVLRVRELAGLLWGLAMHRVYADGEARGRRTPHDEHRTAAEAHAMADVWKREVLVPYVAQHLAEAHARFDAWALRHLGTTVSLERMLSRDWDDPETDGDADAKHVFMTRLEGFSLTLRQVEDGADCARTRENFAFWLHYDYHFDEALAVLDRLLADAPDDAEGLALRAHIQVHLGRCHGAIDALLALVDAKPACAKAWETLAWAFDEVQNRVAAQGARERALELRAAERRARTQGAPA